MIHFSLRKQLGELALHAEANFGHERIVISGENGSGKTTLLRLIAGLERPDHGEISVHDRCCFDSHRGVNLSAHKRRVGCLFVQPALLPWLSVEENICIGLHIEQRESAADAMRELVRTLNLGDVMAKASRHLSAGEAQRVALARTLMASPTLLLLDEPFSAQSARMREYLQQWLIELHRTLRFPMIMVTHDKQEAARIGERQWYMRNGKLIALEPESARISTPDRELCHE